MPSALSPLIGSFCRDMIRILDSLSFDWNVTPSDGYLLRLKTGKRSLLLFGTLVSRHRKYSDKYANTLKAFYQCLHPTPNISLLCRLVPEIVNCSMKMVKHSSSISVRIDVCESFSSHFYQTLFFELFKIEFLVPEKFPSKFVTTNNCCFSPKCHYFPNLML